jgi:hypothetical protein
MNCGLRISDRGLKNTYLGFREVLECARLAAALDWARAISTNSRIVFERPMESGGKPPHSNMPARGLNQSLVTSAATETGGKQ